MEDKEFKNLYSFFNHIEFCPLCKSRLSTIITFQNSTCEVNNKHLTIHSDEFPKDNFTVDLLDNTISDSYLLSLAGQNNYELLIKRICLKYHFYYGGMANFSNDYVSINNIKLISYHFIRIHGPVHFAINSDVIKSSTSVRITTSDFRIRELNLPFVNFDLSSKKKIDNKLKNIQLLG